MKIYEIRNNPFIVSIKDNYVEVRLIFARCRHSLEDRSGLMSHVRKKTEKMNEFVHQVSFFDRITASTSICTSATARFSFSLLISSVRHSVIKLSRYISQSGNCHDQEKMRGETITVAEFKMEPQPREDLMVVEFRRGGYYSGCIFTTD